MHVPEICLHKPIKAFLDLPRHFCAVTVPMVILLCKKLSLLFSVSPCCVIFSAPVDCNS